MGKLFHGLFITAMLFYAVAAFADTSTIKSRTDDLDAIVVTADRIEEKKRGVPTNITVIDSQTIENSASSDVGGLLREQGFQVNSYPGFLSSVTIRGFRTDAHGIDTGYALVLLNGRRVGTANFSLFELSNIDRIEIIRGPAASQYGSSAMGGVINIITKRGKDGIGGFVELGTGSYDLNRFSAGFEGGINNFDFNFIFKEDSQKDYNIANGDRYEYTGYGQKRNYYFDTGYTFLEKHRIGLNFVHFKVNNTASKAIDSTDQPAYADKINYSTNINYTGSSQSDMFLWNVNYSFGKDEQERWEGDTNRKKSTTDSQNVNGQLTFSSKYVRLTGGADWLYNNVDTPNDPKKASYRNSAGFLLGKLNLFEESLIFSAGGRYDSFDTKNKSNGEKNSKTNFSPSVGVSYSPLEWLKLRANYAQAFKTPTPFQLFSYANYGSYGTYKGNPDLKPEKSNTWEVGTDVSWQYINFGITYFQSKTKDFIATIKTDLNTTSYENLEKTTREGVELDFRIDLGYAFNQDFELVPYFKYNRMLKMKNDKTSNDLKYIAGATLSYGVNFFQPELDLSSNFNVSYTSSIEDYDRTVPSYTVADFTLKKGIADFKNYGKLTLTLAINNLLNERYEPKGGYPAPGRNYYTGLIYNF